MATCKCGKPFFQRSTLQVDCPSCAYKKATAKPKKEKAFKFNWGQSTGKPSKKSAKSKARDLADKWASRFVRLNNSNWDGDFGYCTCFTCGTPHAIKDIDCGHFISRGNAAVRYDLNNMRCQCKKDNRFQQGKHDIFRLNLIKEIGKEEVEKLEALAQEIGRTDEEYYNQMADYFKNMTMMLQQKLQIKIW